MRIVGILAAIGIALGSLPGPVSAGESSGAIEFRRPAEAVAPARALDSLSPGNRLIAQALFNAQKSSTLSGSQAWSLERIAMARAEGRNWGDVFLTLKHDGLVEAQSLGQVVTWYQYHNMSPEKAAPELTPSMAVKLVTEPQPVK